MVDTGFPGVVVSWVPLVESCGRFQADGAFERHKRMRRSFFAAAAVALLGTVGSAQAATPRGTFAVFAVNAQNLNATESQASDVALSAACFEYQMGVPGFDALEFESTRDLDFRTNSGSTTTIAGWFASNLTGVVSGLT